MADFITKKLAQLNGQPLVPEDPYKDISIDSNNWVENEKYWLYNEEQRTPCWFKVRQYRLSGSTLGTAVGHSNFSTAGQLALEMVGLKKKVFTDKQKKAMAIGVKEEDNVRQTYTRLTGLETIELGFCVPKFDHRIGVSVDGVVVKDANGNPVDDLIVEIKTVQRMYRPLLRYVAEQGQGKKQDATCSHVWPTHYDQMQLGMKVLDKKFCDYIVMCVNTKQIFIDRIPFNPEYWQQVLEPGIDNFLKTKLYPLMTESMQLALPPDQQLSDNSEIDLKAANDKID